MGTFASPTAAAQWARPALPAPATHSGRGGRITCLRNGIHYSLICYLSHKIRTLTHIQVSLKMEVGAFLNGILEFNKK